MVHYKRNINLIVILLFPVLSFLLGWNLSQQSVVSEKSPSEKTSAEQEIKRDPSPSQVGNFLYRQKKEKEVDLGIFWETWNQMEANFLETEAFDIQSQVYGAVRGLVDSLGDPYTNFMDPDEYHEFNESMSGEFEGIGAEIGYKGDNVVIVAPLKGAPAEKAGLLPGDIIFRIDGESAQGMSIQDAVMQIRGPKGEKVDLTILREGENEPLEISIVRDNIILDSVEWRIEDQIAIIEISQFGNDVLKEFQKALSEIVLENPKGMVIDLRNNGGGLLDACVEIASEFLDREIIVRTEGRRFIDTGELMAGSGGTFLDIPLVVLINEGSASASEIFAGAMQDHGRALIIGEQSFGKGSVQHVIPLSDGSSLKVTVAKWLTPEGKSINEEGIHPDIAVEMNAQHFENEEDPILDKALEVIKNPEELKKQIQEAAKNRKEETKEEDPLVE